MNKIEGYTPGPWVAKPDSGIKGSAWSLFSQSTMNGYICTTSGNCEANAELIALAPTLYEQHFKMLEALKGCQMVMKLLGYSAIEIEQTIKECEL